MVEKQKSYGMWYRESKVKAQRQLTFKILRGEVSPDHVANYKQETLLV
jgi:hypothetical protein